MKRDELTQYLQSYLHSDEFNDLGPNGLQVEGKSEIKKIITGVSASVALFEAALEQKADAVLTHHGIIWNFERPTYRGGYRERVRLLLANDINLYAYHLPLDAHPEVGNNAELCRLLGIKNMQPFGDYKGQFVGMRGEIEPMAADVFAEVIAQVVHRDPLLFPFGPDVIRKVGIISGGAQKEISQAVAAGLDAFVTGEVSEHIMHYAQEEGIHFIAAGHYATEQFGVQALGRHLAEKFDVQVEYIDVPNPV